MTTACKDCKFFMYVGTKNEGLKWYFCFCKASPRPLEFEPISGQKIKPNPEYELCRSVNFGNCKLFQKRESS